MIILRCELQAYFKQVFAFIFQLVKRTYRDFIGLALLPRARLAKRSKDPSS